MRVEAKKENSKEGSFASARRSSIKTTFKNLWKLKKCTCLTPICHKTDKRSASNQILCYIHSYLIALFTPIKARSLMNNQIITNKHPNNTSSPTILTSWKDYNLQQFTGQGRAAWTWWVLLRWTHTLRDFVLTIIICNPKQLIIKWRLRIFWSTLLPVQWFRHRRWKYHLFW